MSVNESILDSIEMIQETCMDSEYDVFNSLSKTYNKCVQMISNSSDMESVTEIVQEATTAPDTEKKPGVFKRILTFLINILRFIGQQLARFGRFIMSLIRGKKETADQIAEDVGVQPKTSEQVENDTTKPSAQKSVAQPTIQKKKIKGLAKKKYTPKVDKSIGTVSKTISIHVETETGTETVDEDVDIDLIMKSLHLKLFQDGTFSFRYFLGNWTVYNRNGRPMDSRKNPMSQARNPMWVFLMLKDSDFFADFLDQLELLFNAIKTNDTASSKTLAKKVKDMAAQHHNGVVNEDERFKYQTVIRMQKKVSEFVQKAQETQNSISSIGENEKDVIETLNIVVGFLNEMQMSLNTTTSVFNSVYDIDAVYEGTVKDKSVLAEFVNKCIKSGMPSKNVIFNAYLISIPELRGEKITIKAGQSRAVMFPDNDESNVYKIATSGLGIVSNKDEKKISDLARTKYPQLKDLIAIISESLAGGALVVQERALPSEKIERLSVNNRVINAFDDFLKSNPSFPYDFRDIHYDNIGKSSNSPLGWVAIDYGGFNRRRQ